MPGSNRTSLTVIKLAAVCIVSGCVSVLPEKPPPPSASPSTVPPADSAEIFRQVSFEVLPGWKTDDLREAWPAFLASCAVLGKRAEWAGTCRLANTVDSSSRDAVRGFFETNFTPFQINNADGSTEGL